MRWCVCRNDQSPSQPRHAVRSLWNVNAVRKDCERKRTQLFICPAEDRIRNRSLTLEERFGVASRSTDKSGRRRAGKNELPNEVELAVGMKVMVTTKVETDLDLTNGARGEFVEIVLHLDEPRQGLASVVRPKYLPIYVLVKMNRTRASRLPGLATSVIPIEPSKRTFQIKLVKGNLTKRVHRRQFAMTPAYAFTDSFSGANNSSRHSQHRQPTDGRPKFVQPVRRALSQLREGDDPAAEELGRRHLSVFSPHRLARRR